MADSNKSIIQTQPTTLDPNFFLPPNVVDMRYKQPGEEGDSEFFKNDSGELIPVVYGEEIPSDASGSTDGSINPLLLPPNNVTVVAQEVRVATDGRYVVDVILDVDDIPGVIQFDVRLTKV